MIKLARLLAVLVILRPAGASAQLPLSLGERIRIRHSDGARRIGSLDSVSAEAVRLGGLTVDRAVVIARADIREIERSLGKDRNFDKHFGIAVASTAVAMSLVEGLTWSPCEAKGFTKCLLHPSSRIGAFGFGLAAGVVIGLPIGTILGLTLETERWERATLPGSSRANISLLPMFGPRFGVTGSISFGGS